MVKSCCVQDCREKFVKGGPVTFHCFPKDETRRRLWESKLKQENFTANQNSSICSKHFRADCFEREKYGGTWLTAVAVPTIFNFSPDESETEEPISSDCAEERNNSNMESLSKEEENKNEVQEKPITLEDQKSYEEQTKSHLESHLLARQKRCYYLGDFSKSDMSSPQKAAQLLKRAKEEKKKDVGKIKNLMLKTHLLRIRVAALKQTLKEVRKRPSRTDTGNDALKNSKMVPAEEKGHILLEPIVEIKEEPMDFDPNQSSSTEITNEKFISSHDQNTWTSRNSVVEPQLTLSVACLASPSVPETSDHLETKPPPTFVPSINSPESTQQNFVSSFGQFSNPAFPKDQFQAFGEYVATNLRSMDLNSSAFAQKTIRDIVEALSGK